MPLKPVAPATPAGPISGRLLAIILLIVSIGIYANTIGHGFVLDDQPIFQHNRIVSKGIAGIPEILRTPYWHGYTTIPNGLYRPLPLVLFAIEKDLFGLNPLPGHVLTVLLYGACVVLLFRFITRLAGPGHRYTAFFATLLFAVHPVHTEVVANIKSCDELLCFGFAMLALISTLRYQEEGTFKFLAGAGLLYFLSLLSKESSIFLAVFVPLMAFMNKRASKSRAIRVTVAFAIAATLFLTIRWGVLQTYQNGEFRPSLAENSLAVAAAGMERLANSFVLLGRYLKLLFIPSPLLFDYSYSTIPLQSWGSEEVWLSTAIYLALAGYMIIRLKRNPGDTAASGILFYLGGIALFSNLFFLIGTTFGERFLFLPSAGFCIALAFLLEKPVRNQLSGPGGAKTILVVSGLAVLVVFAGLAITRNADWEDDETLFEADLEKAPRNFKIPFYLATYHVLFVTQNVDPQTERINLEQAIPLLQRSIYNFDKFNPSLAQLGNVYMKTGRPDSGLYFNRLALAITPTDTFTRTNIAAYYFMKGDYQEAIRLSRENLKINEHNRQAYANIGACYMKMGKPDSAIRVLQRAWELEPENPRTGYFLNVAFGMNGQPDSARRYETYAKGNR
jgi:tetratricopeptide (TPR) repeat protein